MPVVISMFIAVLIWSLYPLVASIGLQGMSSLEMILVIYFISGIGASLMGGFYLYKEKKISQVIAIHKSLNKRAYAMGIASGVCAILCHSLFIIALSLAHKGGVSLLYESWPIIAVIATPFFMKKQWKEVSFKEFAVSIIALVGVAIIILSDEAIHFNPFKNDSNYNNFSFVVLGGYILAFVGAYTNALTVVTKGRFSEYFSDLKDDYSASMVAEIFCRTVSFVIMFFVFLFYKDQFSYTNINWWAAFYIGFVVLVVGGAIYTYSLLKTDRPTIHIIYYFCPVLAVIWLYFAGETTLNWGVLFGGTIIVASNIYLALASRKAKMSRSY